MPQPSDLQLHVDRWLTNMAIAWEQDEANFVAARVFPTIPVLKQSDKYLIFEKGFFYRKGQIRPRPLGGRPVQIGYGITDGRYECEEWSLEVPIDDRERANADVPADPDVSGMLLLSQQMLIQRDVLWTEAYFTTGVWGTDLVGASSGPPPGGFLQWDQTGTDPVVFLRTQRNKIGRQTGFMPNKAVFGIDAWETFINHKQVRDRVKYTQQAADVTRTEEQIAAAVLKLNEVLVPTGVANAAEEGQSDDIDVILGSNDVLLVYSAPNPSIRMPSGGYGFAWTGLLPGVDNAFGGVIQRGRDELAHSDILQGRADYDQQVVASELGLFMQSVAATPGATLET